MRPKAQLPAFALDQGQRCHRLRNLNIKSDMPTVRSHGADAAGDSRASADRSVLHHDRLDLSVEDGPGRVVQHLRAFADHLEMLNRIALGVASWP